MATFKEAIPLYDRHRSLPDCLAQTNRRQQQQPPQHQQARIRAPNLRIREVSGSKNNRHYQKLGGGKVEIARAHPANMGQPRKRQKSSFFICLCFRS